MANCNRTVHKNVRVKDCNVAKSNDPLNNGGNIILNSSNITYDGLQTLYENKLIHEYNCVFVRATCQ